MSENIHHLSGNLLVGSSHFFVDTTNNRVGITTADPDAGLHVNSNAYVNTDFRVGSGIAMNVTSGRITAGSFDGDGSLLSGVNSDSGSWVNGTNSNVHLATSTDNVGIGIDNPGHKLDVNGDINIATGSTLKVGGTPAVFSNWSVDGSDIYRPSGNVGIGVTPDVKLHVGGGDVGIDRDQKFDFGAGYSSNWYIKQKSADNKIYFERTGGSGNELVIDTTGNVGIGTSSPQQNLHVHETGSGQVVIAVTNDTTGGGNNDGIHFGIDGSENGFVWHKQNTALIFATNNVERMRITNGGNMGIGTSSPDHKLEVNGTFRASGYVSTPYLYRSSHNSGYMVGSYNSVGANSFNVNPIYTMGSNYMPTGDNVLGNMYGIGYSHSHFTNLLNGGWGMYVAADGDVRIGLCGSNGRIKAGGAVYVGTLGLDAGATGNQRKNLFIQSTYGTNTSANYGWWLGTQNQGLSSSDNDLYFTVVRNGSYKECGVMLDQGSGTLNFTGQHRTFVKNTPTNQLVDKEGLIVSADQNEFVKMSGGVVCGNEAITINESLPLVSLATKANDKKCFGVLSTTEDPETRKEVHGNFVSNMQKEEGDTRVYVNSVGEGALWVTNINGILESGDYITTSNVAGYGMKQNDDILHNYTVAKILMDCDFNPVTQPKRIIKKEPKMVDYWIQYGDVKITEEEYHTLPDSRRKIVKDVHHRIDQMEVVKEDPEKDDFVYEQREDIVNVLDEHGQFQWEDSGETEKAYKVRYLLPDGTQISEEEYTTRASMDEKVYIAAFVGCTYHCG